MSAHIIHADARAGLAMLDTASVQLAICSPPYFGLRAYGTAPQTWGATDPRCGHEWGDDSVRAKGGAGQNKGVLNGVAYREARDVDAQVIHQGAFCRLCGCWRGELGSEPTPDLFVAHLVDVFRCVHRVLRDDGVCVVNIGDSMSGGDRGRNDGKSLDNFRPGDSRQKQFESRVSNKPPDGLPAKNLLEMPSRFALAMQADGWILRSRMPWIKASSLPESCRDRPSNALEYVFLFSKQARYYWDGESVRREGSGLPWNSAQSTLAANGKKNVTLYETGQRRTAGAPTYHPNTAQTGRSMRNTDLFNDTLALRITALRAELAHLESVQRDGGLLADANGDPLALLVNPEPLKSVVEYDTHRTASPDCPVHANLADSEPSRPDDAQRDAFLIDHISHSDDHLVQEREVAAFASSADHLASLSGDSSAIRHSTEESKREFPCIPEASESDKTPSHIGYSESSNRPAATSDHNHASSIAADSVSRAPDRAEQMSSRNAGTDMSAVQASLLDAALPGVGPSIGSNNISVGGGEDPMETPSHSEDNGGRLAENVSHEQPRLDAARNTSANNKFAGDGESAAEIRIRNVGIALSLVYRPNGCTCHYTVTPRAIDHFAAFPTNLVRVFVKAATSQAGCCPKCRAPYVREVERTAMVIRRTDWGEKAGNRTAASGTMLEPARSTTLGWSPSCSCNAVAADTRPDDLELIATPTGERVGDDPTLVTGRHGYNRPRGSNEGTRSITRYEQRKYAEQLRSAEQRAAMEQEAGPAFAHYRRTDASGARPIPDDLLENWISRGWLQRVTVPSSEPLPPVPCVVLDPFLGSGTTAVVCQELGRDCVGLELSGEYVELARKRIVGASPLYADVTVEAAS